MSPPSPLANVLLAIRQVRVELAWVTRTLEEGRYADAADVVASARARLAEVSWALTLIGGAERAVEEAAARLRHPSGRQDGPGLR